MWALSWPVQAMIVSAGSLVVSGSQGSLLTRPTLSGGPKVGAPLTHYVILALVAVTSGGTAGKLTLVNYREAKEPLPYGKGRHVVTYLTVGSNPCLGCDPVVETH